MLQRYLRRFSVGLVLAAGAMLGQTPPAKPTFEVASIKPSPPLTSITPAMLQSGKVHMGMVIDGARVDIGMMSLPELIQKAYDVKPYQVSGPDWMAAQRFDIMAKLPEGATKDQVPAMLQALLADRFKMTMHREKKDHSVYALVVAKGGPKLKASDPELDKPPLDKPPSDKKTDAPPPTIVVNGQSVTQSKDGQSATITGGPTGPVRTSLSAAGQHIEASKITLPALADLLAPLVDRPVVDMTELKGTYQLTIDIPMEEIMAIVAKQAAAAGIALPPGAGAPGGAAAPVPADPAGGTIFQIVQQFGLKLDPRKEPVEVIVLDHLEKTPTEN
jgi:uncharacterized protein (TIGR03435 family)